jgi:photosystem II stability/assembly factor-like uncharacterized protein
MVRAARSRCGSGEGVRIGGSLAPVIAAVLSAPLLAQAPGTPRWTLVTTGVTARLRGISAPSSRVIWASGTGGTVIRTGDGGATWSRLEIPDSASLDFRDIDAVDERTAYVLSTGDGDASRIYKTSDAGRTWALQFRNDNPRAFYDAMAFRDARTGFAVSDSVDGRMIVIATTDGGAHWSPIANGLPPALEGEGAFAASGTNIALGRRHVWIGTNAARVVRSTDNGRTWTVTNTPVPASASAGIFSIAFADANRGVVVGGDYKVESGAVNNGAFTIDGGQTWTLVTGLGGFRSAVTFIPSSPGTAVAVGPSGADYSTDSGRTWTLIEGPGFHTLAVARGTRTVWGAGEKGTVGRISFQ